MLGNSVVVVVVVVHTRPRAIPLAMITMRKSTHGFPLHSRDKYGAPLGGPWGRRSSAIIKGPYQPAHSCNGQFSLCLLLLLIRTKGERRGLMVMLCGFEKFRDGILGVMGYLA